MSIPARGTFKLRSAQSVITSTYSTTTIMKQTAPTTQTIYSRLTTTYKVFSTNPFSSPRNLKRTTRNGPTERFINNKWIGTS